MKEGDLVKIDGKPYKVVKDGFPMLKDECEIYHKCPIKCKSDLCIARLKLEYSKWYDCKKVMPEDFDELKTRNNYDTKRVAVLSEKMGNTMNIDHRHKNGSWSWYSDINNGKGNVTRWMAIP